MTTPDATGPVRPLPDPHGPEKPSKANDEAISEALAALAENARLRSQLAEAREQRDQAAEALVHAETERDEARDRLRTLIDEVERHAGAQCACDTNGECLARLYQQAHALTATAPETAPTAPQTDEQTQVRGESHTEPQTGSQRPLAVATGRPSRADGADIIRDLRRQLAQEHEAAEWRQKCIDEAIAAIHDAPQEIAPLLPPVAPADLPRAVRALIDRARSQLVEALVRALTAETELDEARDAQVQHAIAMAAIDAEIIDDLRAVLALSPGQSLTKAVTQLRDDLAWLRRQVLAVAEDLERYASDLRPEKLPMSERKLAWTLRQIVAGERPDAPETAPESPHTAEPAPEQAEASTEHLGDAEGAVAYWRAEISEILAAWLGEEQRTGWQRLTSDVAEQIIRDLDIADMAAERDRLRTEAAMLRARVREWEAVNSDLAERCDSGDIPIRLGERYSLAVLREIDRLRDQWRTLATLVEPLGILDADSNDPATLTDRICRWISDLREDSAYQARVLGERQQEIDQLRAERDRLLEELPEDNTIVAAVRGLRAARSATPDTGSTT